MRPFHTGDRVRSNSGLEGIVVYPPGSHLLSADYRRTRPTGMFVELIKAEGHRGNGFLTEGNYPTKTGWFFRAEDCKLVAPKLSTPFEQDLQSYIDEEMRLLQGA